jgi:hypothetical protein
MQATRVRHPTGTAQGDAASVEAMIASVAGDLGVSLIVFPS